MNDDRKAEGGRLVGEYVDAQNSLDELTLDPDVLDYRAYAVEVDRRQKRRGEAFQAWRRWLAADDASNKPARSPYAIAADLLEREIED